MNEKVLRSGIPGSIWGLIVGDALGVPVEFRDREGLRRDPVTGMREYGTHYQPLGTWSDDTSMMLGTMESLCGGTQRLGGLCRQYGAGRSVTVYRAADKVVVARVADVLHDGGDEFFDVNKACGKHRNLLKEKPSRY